MKSRRVFHAVAGILLLALGVATGWRRHHPSPAPSPLPSPTPAAHPEPAGGPLAPLKSPSAPAADTGSPPRPAGGTPAPSPAVLIEGRLLNHNRESLPFEKVELFILDPLRTLTRQSVETDERGEFQVGVPMETRVALTAHPPNEGRVVYPITAGATSSGSRSVTLVTRAPFSVDGLAVRADGTPMAQARLVFHPVSRPYLDPDQGRLDLNLINGSVPPDVEWDEQCRRELFLTDGELVTDPDGAFHARFLTTRTKYRVEAVLPGGEHTGTDFSTNESRGTPRLQFPR